MIIKFIENIGDKTIQISISFYDIFLFFKNCIFHLFSISSYNKTTIKSLIKQIYYTSIGILPIFIIMAILIGFSINAIIISLATQYNLQDKVGTILFTFIIEFAPFFTTFLISLRSGIAINTKIAIMKVSKEFENMEINNINLFNIIIPKIISGIISTVLLSILFLILFFICGYIFTISYMHIDVNIYKFLILNAFELYLIIFLLFKSIIFGFIAMTIPIYHGLKTNSKYSDVSKSVSKGIISLFIVLFFIELLSLLIIL